MERRPRILMLLGLASVLALASGCGGASSSSSTVLDSTASPGAPAAPGTSVATAPVESSSLTTSSTPGLSVSTVVASPVSSAASAASVPAELRIRIWERGRKAGEPIESALTCGGAPTGTVKDPAAACAQLAAAGAAAFAPVGADRVCTMIYGGASEATIEGTFSGRPVTASYSLRNGCEIARWDRLSTILAAHTPTATSVTP